MIEFVHGGLRFLELLQVLVEDNSRQFEAFTQDIVNFCIERSPLIVHYVEVTSAGFEFRIVNKICFSLDRRGGNATTCLRDLST